MTWLSSAGILDNAKRKLYEINIGKWDLFKEFQSESHTISQCYFNNDYRFDNYEYLTVIKVYHVITRKKPT